MNQKLKEILLKVDKPARYVGGEFNAPGLSGKAADVKYLMCFPDVYEVALSNLGIKILIDILNGREGIVCDNCFAPWPDMGKILKEEKVALYGAQLQLPMKEYDILGFSLQYELSYTTVLYMLDLGGIPLRANEREEDCPLVSAGGPCCVNPEPVADIFDFITLGDGENAIAETTELIRRLKKAGKTRAEILSALAEIEGVYVPSLNQKTVKRRIEPDLDSLAYPLRFIIPNIEAVHNRAVLEIFRGCTRGCRFCQAGFIYRPVRERSVDKLCEYAEALIVNNGFDEISLSSLSTCDYPYLKDLLQRVKPIADKYKVRLSLPSTRLDSFEGEFTESSRLSSLTFAPEAGTQRLRDVINKNVSEEDIFKSLTFAFERGYSSVKLYFMIGLPTETQEDLDGIISLSSRIKTLYKNTATAGKPLRLAVSSSTFVPKPFTPFQWERQINADEIKQKQTFLREGLKKLGIKFGWHDAETSVMEGVLARGDRKLCEVLIKGYESGAYFDSWSEYFNASLWHSALSVCGVTAEEYTSEFHEDAALAWDKFDVGVTKEYLLQEKKKAYEGQLTPDCRGDCKVCGIEKRGAKVYANCLAHSKLKKD